MGRIAGHRGRGGEVTVHGCGRAEAWLGVERVRVVREDRGRDYAVESCRAYRDRLVLKLKGVDDANSAAGLRGHQVWVAREDAPELPDGVHYVAELVGMLVEDEEGRPLGRVEDMIMTGAADVLRVVPLETAHDGVEEEDELLIPLAGPFVRAIDREERRIVARVPRELRELNRPNRPSG